MENEKPFRERKMKSALVRAVFVVTFVIVLAFGAWGGVTAVKYFPAALSRVWENVSGNLSAAVIDISSRFFSASNSAPKNTPEGGSDAALVDNQDGTALQTGGSSELGAPEDKSETDGTPLASADAATSESGAENNTSLPAAPVAGTQTEVLVPLQSTPVFEDPNGVPDFAVSVTAVGILNPQTNEFVAQDSMKTSDRGAVAFSIMNAGTKTVPEGWTFSAVLPTSPAHVYASDPQQSLAPGDRIDFTLGFDRVAPDAEKNATVTITADPGNSTPESDENNNTAEATIAISE